MCSPFSCSSFKNWKEFDLDELPTPIKTPPQKSKSYRSFSFRTKRKDGHFKNPYANQGLDKFAKLLAELEAQKQKIYTQKGSEDISLVYFTYTNSDQLQPFIVRVNKQRQPADNVVKNNKEKEVQKRVPEVVKKDSVPAAPNTTGKVEEENRVRKKELRKSRTHRRIFKLEDIEDLKRVFSFFSVTIILILLLLAFSGRSFAIVCVTVAWYLVPMLPRTTSPVQRTNDRK